MDPHRQVILAVSRHVRLGKPADGMLRAMRRQEPVRGFFSTFKRQHSVSNPIACDTVTFRDAKNRKRSARVEIGQPQPIPEDPDHDWFCPLFIEGWTLHVVPAIGIGPLDSLMNAVTVLRGFHEHIGTMHLSYATTKRKRRRSR